MDKVIELDTILTHAVTITERKNIMISGVKKIDSFDNEEFLIETLLGYIIVKGADLEIVKLDTLKGNIAIKGRIESFNYIDDNSKSKSKDDGLLNRLFK